MEKYELTLDGYIEKSAAGPGCIPDSLSRAFAPDRGHSGERADLKCLHLTERKGAQWGTFWDGDCL